MMIESKFIHLTNLTQEDIEELLSTVPLIAIDNQAVIPTECLPLVHIRFQEKILQHIGEHV